MKTFFGFPFLIAMSMVGSTLLSAAEPEKKSGGDAQKVALGKLGEAIKAHRSIEEATAAARKAGVPPQSIAELKYLAAVRDRDFPEMTARLQELEQDILPQWRAEDSVAFEEKSEFEGVMFFGKALLATEGTAGDVFEQSVKQAFWMNPDLAPALAEEVKARRSTRRMGTLTLPMATKFEKSQGGGTSLADLAQGKKALLLDFWATWCGPCMSALPNLVKRAAELAPQNVAVVGINTEAPQSGGVAEAQKKTENVRKQKNISFAWLVEPTERPLSKLLKIDSIPRAILVSPEGKVLYSGHPEDPRLVTALQGIGVTLPK